MWPLLQVLPQNATTCLQSDQELVIFLFVLFFLSCPISLLPFFLVMGCFRVCLACSFVLLYFMRGQGCVIAWPFLDLFMCFLFYFLASYLSFHKWFLTKKNRRSRDIDFILHLHLYFYHFSCFIFILFYSFIYFIKKSMFLVYLFIFCLLSAFKILFLYAHY